MIKMVPLVNVSVFVYECEMRVHVTFLVFVITQKRDEKKKTKP